MYGLKITSACSSGEACWDKTDLFLILTEIIGQCYGDCLEVKREYYQNCSVLGCVTQCSQSAAH